MDIELFYIEKGQGEPLIMLHGNGENCMYFSHQIEPFSKSFHVYAIDTRGHGKTPRGDRPFTIRQFAEDLLGFMEIHGMRKANILGFSDGANIAMVFAINYPARVNKLVLNGANTCAKGVRRSVQIPIEIGYRIASAFAGKSVRAKSNAEMLGLMVNEPNVKAEDLSKIKAKTLVIAGTRDMILEEHTKFIADYILNAELALIAGDHFIAKKNPGAFNQRVLQFLTQ